MTLKKNDIVNLTITSATAEGSGVGRTDDGIAVFVQGSAIGDELNARILKVKKTYAFGKIEEILVPSKARITPDCENFMKCGGCTWRHISYEEECKIKQQRVEDAVTRIGGLDNVVFKPIISSDNITRYRNKAQYPVGLDRDGNVVTGFYSFHSHRIINCTDCILQPEIFARVIEITKDFIAKTNTEIYDETTGKGRLRHIYIRIGEVSGELMGNFLRKRSKELADLGVTCIFINQLRKKLGAIGDIQRAVVTVDGKEIPSQLDDTNRDCTNDELCFLADLGNKKETARKI